MTEPDPKYWPPEFYDDESGSNLGNYRKIWQKEGKYPPKLTEEEKAIVDRQGKFDSKGNKYAVCWSLGGHPIAAKIDKYGYEYHDNNNSGKYTRYAGCFNIVTLDD